MRRPYYHEDDSRYLLIQTEPLFYLRLGNGGLMGILRSMESAGESYKKFLNQYPAVLCEPLDLFYLCRRSMCSLNDELLQDLLFSYSWREANWGAWLAALAPQASYVPHLQQRRASLPHATKIVDLALAACGQAIPDALEEYDAELQAIKGMLHTIPATSYPMRLCLTVEDEPTFNSEREDVRIAYRRGDISLANDLLKKGLLKYHCMSYRAWLAEGAPMPPKHLATSPDKT